MITQLILGIMNPFVMVVIGIVITAEKLFPRPEVTVRIAGIATIITGVIMTIRWTMLHYT